jgi:hypothetical protein
MWGQRSASGRCVIEWLPEKGLKRWEEGKICKSVRKVKRLGRE